MLAVTARSHCGYRGFCSSGDVPKVQPRGRGPTTLYVNRIGLGLSVLLIPALRRVPLLLCGSSKAAPAPSSQARVRQGHRFCGKGNCVPLAAEQAPAPWATSKESLQKHALKPLLYPPKQTAVRSKMSVSAAYENERCCVASLGLPCEHKHPLV